MKSNWIKIGEFGVDAGLVWIGDPCYILHKAASPSEIGNTWGEFCKKLEDKKGNLLLTKEFPNGLGVVSSTGYGDGSYPVYARIEKGRVLELRIIFDEE